MQEVAVVQRLQAEELKCQIALGLQRRGDSLQVEARQIRIEQFDPDTGLDIGREIFTVTVGHVGLRGIGRHAMDVGKHFGAQSIEQQPRTDIGIIWFLLHQRARGHHGSERQFVLADAVIDVALDFGDHRRRIDAVQTGAGLVDDQRKACGIERHFAAIGQRHMQ